MAQKMGKSCLVWTRLRLHSLCVAKSFNLWLILDRNKIPFGQLSHHESYLVARIESWLYYMRLNTQPVFALCNAAQHLSMRRTDGRNWMPWLKLSMQTFLSGNRDEIRAGKSWSSGSTIWPFSTHCKKQPIIYLRFGPFCQILSMALCINNG